MTYQQILQRALEIVKQKAKSITASCDEWTEAILAAMDEADKLDKKK